MDQVSHPDIQIVLIEDDEDDYVITLALLEEGLSVSFSLDWVRSYEDGLDALTSAKYDVALVDFRLGPDSGLDLIAEARRRGIAQPAILLTGQGDDLLDANAIELGASDYLVKGLVDAQTLARSIRYTIDRAHATLSLSLSEARYRLLFEGNPEPLVLVDPQSQEIISLNTAAIGLYGFVDGDNRITGGLHMLDLVSSKDSSTAMEGFVYPGTYQPADGAMLMQHCRQNGEHFFAEVTSNQIVLNKRDVLLLMIVDVSEKIRALQRAEQNEEAFLQVLNDLRDATLVVDLIGTVHFANPAAQMLLMQSPDIVQSLGLNLEADQDGNAGSFKIPSAEGQNMWVEVQCSSTRWHGESMRLLSMRDITDRTAAESRLRLLQRSIEASSNGITIADACAEDLPLIYVNPAFERITGYPADEVLGRNCRLLQAEDRDSTTTRQIRQALAERREISVVTKNIKKDGSVFWNDLFIAPVPDEHGVVTHFIGVQNDISDRKSAESALAYNASHDALTGLPNRSLLEDRLVQGREFAFRHQRKLALLCIGLDDIKLINDSLGHVVGDQILIEAAKRLQSVLRAGDTVARLNADEFVVLLPDMASGEHATGLAEEILKVLVSRFVIGDRLIHLTVSVGIALDAREIENPMEILQQADLAMQRAKLHGRNTYQWYSTDLNTDAMKRVLLRNELQAAIEEEHLSVFYQPLIDSRTGEVVGTEALVRWIHPGKGIIPPDEFLSVAEDTGQILQIGPWVMEKACADTVKFHELGFADLTVAVNVAALQLRQPNFVETVEAALERSGLAPSYLELEVVESVLLQDTQAVISAMNQLKDLGIGISIDDFGTGFSSLSYIKMLPATKIKIDRAFIKDVIRDKSDSAITQGVISMAHHLGLKTVAEGVETDAQAAFLRRNRCDLMQGYLFSRPVPFEVFIEWLNRQRLANEQGGAEVLITGDRKTLLLLDDEENILKALSRALRRDGYRILTAKTAAEAFDQLAQNEVQVVVSDQRMPEISGTEFLSQVKAIYPDTIRIVLSGYTDLRSVTDAINEGNIYKFLTKPWDDGQIREHIAQAFLHYFAAMKKNRSTYV